MTENSNPNQETISNSAETNEEKISYSNLTIPQLEEKISDFDRDISQLSETIHSLESQLELVKSNVDVLKLKAKDSDEIVKIYFLVFFMFAFSFWINFH